MESGGTAMKRFIFCSLIFLLVFIAFTSADEPLRSGKTAVVTRINFGKNHDDPIAQLGIGIEHGIFPHLAVGLGYVYIDGIDPLQEHGLDLFLRGLLYARELALYADAGIQTYFSGGIDGILTLKSGLEWQSPFRLFGAVEGGVEMEGSNWGSLYGIRVGCRF